MKNVANVPSRRLWPYICPSRAPIRPPVYLLPSAVSWLPSRRTRLCAQPVTVFKRRTKIEFPTSEFISMNSQLFASLPLSVSASDPEFCSHTLPVSASTVRVRRYRVIVNVNIHFIFRVPVVGTKDGKKIEKLIELAEFVWRGRTEFEQDGSFEFYRMSVSDDE